MSYYKRYTVEKLKQTLKNPSGEEAKLLKNGGNILVKLEGIVRGLIYETKKNLASYSFCIQDATGLIQAMAIWENGSFYDAAASMLKTSSEINKPLIIKGAANYDDKEPLVIVDYMKFDEYKIRFF